jgi:hypothetical protein
LAASVFSSKPLFHFQHVLRKILIHAIILPAGIVVAKWIALFHEFTAVAGRGEFAKIHLAGRRISENVEADAGGDDGDCE